MSELSSELKEFVAKERGESASFLSESMNLQSDLSLWGDDAIEFFEAYKMKFQVDLSEFVISKYFKPEGDIILPTIIRVITGKKTKYLPLTLGDLDEGIKNGKLT